MSSALTLAEFRARTVMPSADVDQVEALEPGWILQQLTSYTGRIYAQLSKRYDTPFSAPVPDVVLDWLTRVVTVRVYVKRGVNPSDEQFAAIKADADAAVAEIAAAADSQAGLYELPLRQDTTASGVTRGGPLGYSEQSPYTWATHQRDDARGET